MDETQTESEDNENSLKSASSQVTIPDIRAKPWMRCVVMHYWTCHIKERQNMQT